MHVLRICDQFYSPNYNAVGLSQHTYNLTMALTKQGVNQTILCCETDFEKPTQFKILKFNKSKRLSVLLGGINAFNCINQLKQKFDVIHFHNPGFALLGLFKSKLPPLVMTIHGSPFELIKHCDYHSFRAIKEAWYYFFLTWIGALLVDKVVCVSKGVSDDLSSKLKISSKKVTTITTAIDPEIFFPKKSKKNIDVLVVGRFASVKRYEDVLNAINKVLANFPQLRVVFVGGSKTDEVYIKVLALIKEKKVGKNIKLIPLISQKKLASYYRRSKMLVNASVAESSPKVILEAMACGTPIISTDIVGVKGLVLNNKNGLLVPIKSPLELASAILTLLNEARFRKKLEKNAIKTVKRFTWVNIAKAYKQLYLNLS